MATIKILLRNKPNNSGEYPVVMRITKNRKSKIITLGMYCNPAYWDKNKCEIKKAHTLSTQLNTLLVQKKMEAMQVIADFETEKVDFTLEQFRRRLLGEKSKDISISDFWLEKIDDLIKSGRIGNARFHKCSYNSFFRFCKSKSTQFRDITLREVEKYEVFLLESNNKGGGIAAKMRALRAVFNDAINKGVIDIKYSPFNKYKVSKHKSNSLKKALTKEQVKSIEALDLTKFPHLTNARHYFIFSYYSRGMNFMDMMQLKWDDISDGRIEYVRSKTKGRFSLKITEPLKFILSYFKEVSNETEYIFPILLKENLNPVQIENRKLRTLKKYNSELKDIAAILKIDQKLTSYTARHSFATNLKFLGVSIEIISQSMGHKDVATTNAYLKKFDLKVVDNEVDKLLEEPFFRYAS